MQFENPSALAAGTLGYPQSWNLKDLEGVTGEHASIRFPYFSSILCVLLAGVATKYLGSVKVPGWKRVDEASQSQTVAVVWSQRAGLWLWLWLWVWLGHTPPCPYHAHMSYHAHHVHTTLTMSYHAHQVYHAHNTADMPLATHCSG